MCNLKQPHYLAQKAKTNVYYLKFLQSFFHQRQAFNEQVNYRKNFDKRWFQASILHNFLIFRGHYGFLCNKRIRTWGLRNFVYPHPRLYNTSPVLMVMYMQHMFVKIWMKEKFYQDIFQNFLKLHVVVHHTKYKWLIHQLIIILTHWRVNLKTIRCNNHVKSHDLIWYTVHYIFRTGCFFSKCWRAFLTKNHHFLFVIHCSILEHQY